MKPKLKLNAIELNILTGASRDLRSLKARKPIRGRDWGWHRWQQAYEVARQNVVECDTPRWLNMPLGPSVRKAISRGYERMHQAGLLIRIAGPCATHTTCLQITRAGLAMASKLKRAGAAK